MSGTAQYALTNFTTQDSTTYKGQIDINANVSQRIAPAFQCYAQTTANMTVNIAAGALFLGGTAPVEKTAQITSAITAPSGNGRVDRVVLNATTGVASVVTGTAAPSPVAPSVPSGNIPVAQIALTANVGAITNNMITDERAFFTNLAPVITVTDPTITVLTSGTAATYTTPAGVTYLKVRGVGPGGGGGGCATAGAAAASGEGGSSGAYFEKLIRTQSATYTYTIGVGGAGGTAGNNPGADGSAATSFTDGTLTLSAAAGKGGSGGGAAASPLFTGSLATGGVTATGGDINLPGSAGGLRFVGSASQGSGGAGGASHLGASVRNAVNSSAVGVVGANYGSGGSGGQDINGTAARAGGAGSNGVIIIEEFYN